MYYHARKLKHVTCDKIGPAPEEDVDPDFEHAYRWLACRCGFYPQVWLSRGSSGIVVDGVRKFSEPVLPFMAFGLCMGLAGLLAHRPLSPDVAFSEFAHQAHSALATLAGISITVGLLWQAARPSSLRARAIAATLAASCLGLPLCMLAFPAVQGIIQRIMYLLMFTWLWIHYPLASSANRPTES